MRETVIFCIGSERVSGDRIGPLVGDLLRYRYNVPCFVYGTTSAPINGINLTEYREKAREKHPYADFISIDAAVGNKEDLGKIKYKQGGVKAGGALGEGQEPFGDVGIMGVVAERQEDVLEALLNVSSSFVTVLAEKIAKIVAGAIFHTTSQKVLEF